MKFRRIGVALGVVGAVVVLAGIGIISMDVGSCPLEPVGTKGSCYHIFAGTNILITPTGEVIVLAGVFLVVSSLAVALYGRMRRSNR
jgi:hypothetical protein